MKLYLDGVQCDLPVDTKVGINIAVDLLKGIKLSYSSRITLPKTSTNNAIMELCGEVNSLGDRVYTMIPARYVDGLEVIPDGFAVVNEVTDEGYEIVIYDNRIDLFTFIKGKQISELNYLPVSAFQATNIDTNRLATSGIVTVVLNWGKPGAIYQFAYFLPSFYYHDLVTSILESTGLTLSGDILTSDDFLELVIPYGADKFEYPESYGKPFSFNATVATTFNQIINTATNYTIIFEKVSGDGFHLSELDVYNPVTGVGTIPSIGISGDFLNVRLECTIGFDVNVWPNPLDFFNIEFVVNGTSHSTISINDISHPVGTGYSETLVAYEEILSAGDTFYVRITNASSNGIDVDFRAWTAVFPDSATKFKMTSPVAVSRTSVNWNVLLPSITQEDVIKDFTARFGIIYKQQNGVLYMKTIEAIMDDGDFVDWTTKRVKHNTSIEFDDGYAQENEFSYQDQADDETLGSGFIDIPDENLPAQKTIFSSAFGNALTAEYSGGNKALIEVYDSGSTGISDFANSPELRLLTIRDKAAGESSITFSGVARSDYKVGYFVDPGEAKDTGFQYFLDNYYNRLGTSLQRQKWVTRLYYLKPEDIANFDPFKMILDGDSYYILPRIKYVRGRVTEVTMMRV